MRAYPHQILEPSMRSVKEALDRVTDSRAANDVAEAIAGVPTPNVEAIIEEAVSEYAEEVLDAETLASNCGFDAALVAFEEMHDAFSDYFSGNKACISDGETGADVKGWMGVLERFFAEMESSI